MTSKHLVDPETILLLESLTFKRDLESLPRLRAELAALFGTLSAADDLPVVTETFFAPGPQSSPEIRLLGYKPANLPGPFPVLLHIHGGGYTMGFPEINDAANRALAAGLGCAVFSVDYRLPPETPHPGPVEDCYAALAWIVQNAAQLNIDPNCIGVKGESAGGGLAAALALLARDRGEYKLAFQHLIYPMLDDRTSLHPDPHPYTGEFVWSSSDNHFGWSCLLNAEPGAPDISPYAAPSRAENLTGLPPAYIAVGALDLFLEEDLDYARRLTRAGIPVELHVYPGGCHGFDILPTARLAQQSLRDSTEALRRSFQK